jgi:hypothetical protein
VGFKVIPVRLEQAAKDEAFFGACTSLSAVALHYNDIDLQGISEAS